MSAERNPVAAPPDEVALAEELARLEPDERAERFRALDGELAERAFVELEAAHQEELLARLDEERRRDLVEALDPDDRARLLDELEDEDARRLLAGLSDRERALTETLLAHPRETAGHLMSPEFLALSPETTVEEALATIRERASAAETINVLPVVGAEKGLAGVVELATLVLASPHERVADVMDEAPRSVQVGDDQEEVARLMQRDDLLALPVVDAEGTLVGLVTVDDAMDVLEFEETEDLARAGGSEPLGRPYLSVPVVLLARSRIVWLLVLVLAATLTVNVLSAFEATLEQAVSLALFIPLLIGTGGNTGAQSATTVVRAMAIDQVRWEDLARVVTREALTGALLGSGLAVLGFVPVWLVFDRPLAVVVCLTLVAICTLAALVGSLMPILARRFGVDPAVVSAPLVTTIVDATGLLVYFLVARVVLFD